MAESGISCARAVATADGPESDDSATRELARRLSGTAEVLLLWHPTRDWVELFLRDPAADAGFRIEVARGKALDAFYHPYAYAVGSERNRARPDATAIDGG